MGAGMRGGAGCLVGRGGERGGGRMLLLTQTQLVPSDPLWGQGGEKPIKKNLPSLLAHSLGPQVLGKWP